MRPCPFLVAALVALSALATGVVFSADESGSPLPRPWQRPKQLDRVFRPTKDLSAVVLIETFILRPLDEVDRDIRYETDKYDPFFRRTAGAYSPRAQLDYYVQYPRLFASSYNEKQGQTEQQAIHPHDRQFQPSDPRHYFLYRCVTLVDPTGDGAKLLTPAALDDYHRRMTEAYQGFPSWSWLREPQAESWGRVTRNKAWRSWLLDPPEWPERSPELLETYELLDFPTLTSREHAKWGREVINLHQALVTAWQDANGVPYPAGPNPVWNTFLWRDYWYREEAPIFASHLQWACERDNAAEGRHRRIFVNASDVVPVTTIDWAAKAAAGKPCYLDTRPPVDRETKQPTGPRGDAMLHQALDPYLAPARPPSAGTPTPGSTSAVPTPEPRKP
jgi:hypothetical protein